MMNKVLSHTEQQCKNVYENLCKLPINTKRLIVSEWINSDLSDIFEQVITITSNPNEQGLTQYIWEKMYNEDGEMFCNDDGTRAFCCPNECVAHSVSFEEDTKWFDSDPKNYFHKSSMEDL